MQNRRQRGFSLVELMIALSIGSIITGVATSIYVMNVKSTSDTIKSTKLVQQSNAMMSMIANDIRRAGYRLTDINSSPTGNLFNNIDDTALEIFEVYTDADDLPMGGDETEGSCVIFAYDGDNDGGLDDGEVTGYRLRNSLVEVRSRQAGAAAVTPRNNCDDEDNDDWFALNESDLIEVTALTFDHVDSTCLNNREPDMLDNDGDGTVDNLDEADCYLNPPANGSGDITVETRQIRITLTSRLADDENSVYTIQQDVRVRNDLVRER